MREDGRAGGEERADGGRMAGREAIQTSEQNPTFSQCRQSAGRSRDSSRITVLVDHVEVLALG